MADLGKRKQIISLSRIKLLTHPDFRYAPATPPTEGKLAATLKDQPVVPLGRGSRRANLVGVLVWRESDLLSGPLNPPNLGDFEARRTSTSWLAI